MRWAGTARYAGSPRWDGFHLTVIWNSLSCFKKFFVQSLFTFIAVAMVLFVLTILKSNLERTLKHIYVHSYLALLFFLAEKAHLRVFIWTIYTFCFYRSFLTLSWRRWLSYRNQSIDLDWFLYDNGLRRERVKEGETSLRSASPPNRASSPRYERPLSQYFYGILVTPRDQVIPKIFLLLGFAVNNLLKKF